MRAILLLTIALLVGFLTNPDSLKAEEISQLIFRCKKENGLKIAAFGGLFFESFEKPTLNGPQIILTLPNNQRLYYNQTFWEVLSNKNRFTAIERTQYGIKVMLEITLDNDFSTPYATGFYKLDESILPISKPIQFKRSECE